MSPNNTTMKNLTNLLIVFCTLAIFNIEAARKSSFKCGLTCYRYERCLQQLSSGENRPNEAGNTGQIFLDTCDNEGCDCEAEKLKKSQSKNQPKDKKEEKKRPSSLNLRKPLKQRTLINRSNLRSTSTKLNKYSKTLPRESTTKQRITSLTQRGKNSYRKQNLKEDNTKKDTEKETTTISSFRQRYYRRYKF